MLLEKLQLEGPVPSLKVHIRCTKQSRVYAMIVDCITANSQMLNYREFQTSTGDIIFCSYCVFFDGPIYTYGVHDFLHHFKY